MLEIPSDIRSYPYKTAGGRTLELSFLPPTVKKYGLAPVCFLITGGGFNTSARETMLDFSRLSVRILRENGFAVVAPDHRVKRDNVTMDEILSDIYDAARYVALNNGKFSIDPYKLFTSGHSSGGYLSLMMAGAPAEIMSNGTAVAAPFRVYASAPLCAPTRAGPSGTALIPCEEAATRCSSDTYAAAMPPVLYVYASHDHWCRGMADELAAKCPSVRLLEVQNSNHSFQPVDQEQPVSPDHDAIQRLICEFALEHLTET
jgi:acetyl esterase/lipase